ncbi:MAG: L-erythro-3,5-diaminohexanoate dehydrogenase [Candidatus Anammoxibacter sp.]
MTVNHLKDGDMFGSHRVVEPKGALPQPAEIINNDVSSIWDNEILVNVEALNIDSASFTQIKKEAGGDENKIKEIVLNIVNRRGKMHNPVTGSGGVLIGCVEDIGERLIGKCNLEKGDKIVSLVSLSLTPLKIYEIIEVKTDIDQIKVNGKAILFETSIYAKLPDDIPDSLALAVLDVCGAPAQTRRLVKSGDTVVIIGAGGKSGILCAYQAKEMAGDNGRVIGIGHSDKSVNKLKTLDLCDLVLKIDAQDALTCYNKISEITGGKLADLVINCVNIPNTELASILMCRNMGKIYFFSMATSFTKAALGAEGVGKDIEMIIGNGYAKGHAEMALGILRKSKKIRNLYETLYC